MGLPLFIAPVESDLVCKAADKTSTTAPLRSAIRRQSQLDPRERRAAVRRHDTIRERIRERMANGTVRVATTTNPRGEPAPPWLADGFPPERQPSTRTQPSSAEGTDDLLGPRPFRDVLREMTQSNDHRREQLEAQIHALFSSHEPGNIQTDRAAIVRAGEERPSDTTWTSRWPAPSRPQLDHSRPLGAMAPQFNYGEELLFPWTRDAATTQPAGSSSANTQQSTITQTTADMSGSNRRPRLDVTSRETVFPFARRSIRRTRNRGVPLQRTRAVDGLGDRDRSLSPEVWDTLLTTLTPDPQPPSAGSSFASTVASQSAGNSSRTSFTAPDPPVATAADQACESAWEHSDTEEPDHDYEHPDFARIRRRREEVRRARMASTRVPDYNLDGPVDGPVDGPPLRRYGRTEADVAALRRRRMRSPDGPLVPTREAGDAGADDLTEADGPSNSQLQRPRHGWVGQLSVGVSDDEQNTERQRLNRESSTGSGANAQLGGEEWQRIVRSLARREDIPDEWWAEAGLSRILPRDATE